MATTALQPRAGRREWIGLAVLALPCMLVPDPRQRTVAIGVWGTSLSVGAAIGPLLGGLLLERFWWGS
ncbi:MAG TPA: hypothetical protein VK631_29775, partial [Solirubrobacteraceae bacterium]|nr:hypothetical protein [Solirubrobacteraceae bacterium]